MEFGKEMLREKANVVITEAAKSAQGVVDNMMGDGQKKPETGGIGGAGGFLSNLAKPAQDAVMGAMQDSGTKQTENAALDPLKMAKSFF
ncbi:hypothetical protein AOXY_G14756 [Acipenser oxyrinchus oxyrinchus]|uniref:Uncharacterized protein n=1 Tax=Acipenser oxyrinchus oxyrinchus TaxID=40147 RepID=A0AAD8G5C4_ACIOX|nr:hypothetical protein AOXY_G14756 [Acipenser oxyrinchus oxyrinchus]